jgi:plastocyanin
VTPENAPTPIRERARRGWPAILAAVAIALTLAACGGDGGSSDNGSSSADSSGSDSSRAGYGSSAAGGGSGAAGGGGSGKTIEVSATDFAFSPSSPSAPAGEVTFAVSNDGAAPHTIEVEGPNGDEELEPTLEPGQSGELTVDLSEPGTYTFFCPIGNHRELGMEGQITITG